MRDMLLGSVGEWFLELATRMGDAPAVEMIRKAASPAVALISRDEAQAVIAIIERTGASA